MPVKFAERSPATAIGGDLVQKCIDDVQNVLDRNLKIAAVVDIEDNPIQQTMAISVASIALGAAMIAAADFQKKTRGTDADPLMGYIAGGVMAAMLARGLEESGGKSTAQMWLDAQTQTEMVMMLLKGAATRRGDPKKTMTEGDARLVATKDMIDTCAGPMGVMGAALALAQDWKDDPIIQEAGHAAEAAIKAVFAKHGMGDDDEDNQVGPEAN